MPRSTKHQQNLDTIQQALAGINPYRRSEANCRTEYYIYNTAFLASYLASLAEEDPYILKKFKKHCAEVQEQQRLRD